jgi:hypothetical protein
LFFLFIETFGSIVAKSCILHCICSVAYVDAWKDGYKCTIKLIRCWFFEYRIIRMIAFGRYLNIEKNANRTCKRSKLIHGIMPSSSGCDEYDTTTSSMMIKYHDYIHWWLVCHSSMSCSHEKIRLGRIILHPHRRHR